MACSSCEKRRRVVRKAYHSEGIQGVIKVTPSVTRDILKNPPKFLTKNRKRLQDGK